MKNKWLHQSAKACFGVEVRTESPHLSLGRDKCEQLQVVELN